jgi:putative phosphoribosyl transferase
MDKTMIFENRWEAGKKLAAKLLDEPLIKQTAKADLLVLSIPRGGVVVGAAVANALGCKHDVVVAKKISLPNYSEAAIGAIAEDGPAILASEIPEWFLQSGGPLEGLQAQTRAKIATYIERFHAGRTLDIRKKMVIVVDDGIATGETMKAALLWLRAKGQAQRPRKILAAVPVGSPRALAEIESLADRVVCLSAPEHFWAVGQFYLDFRQIDDKAVTAYLTCPLDQVKNSSPG